jgi:hypothetical protein
MPGFLLLGVAAWRDALNRTTKMRDPVAMLSHVTNPADLKNLVFDPVEVLF